MPLVESRFRPPPSLRNPHVQTLCASLMRRGSEHRFEPARLELPDGDFLELGWSRVGSDRVAILSHGLETHSGANSIRRLAAALNVAGWDALAWSYRGCGSEPNRLLRMYHGGETEDLGHVIAHAALTRQRIALVGFSLGGNLTLKYLGEQVPHPSVFAAVAISAPVDLGASARQIDRQPGNWFYRRRFIKLLVAKVEAKARMFPGEIDLAGIRAIRTFAEFDDRYTARLHGFRDADDYWSRASARPFLRRVTVPALVLNARDDPFLAPECFPEDEARENECLFLEAPAHGGHIAFLDSLRRSHQPNWLERRTVGFLRGASFRSRLPDGNPSA